MPPNNPQELLPPTMTPLETELALEVIEEKHSDAGLNVPVDKYEQPGEYALAVLKRLAGGDEIQQEDFGHLCYGMIQLLEERDSPRQAIAEMNHAARSQMISRWASPAWAAFAGLSERDLAALEGGGIDEYEAAVRDLSLKAFMAHRSAGSLEGQAKLTVLSDAFESYGRAANLSMTLADMYPPPDEEQRIITYEMVAYRRYRAGVVASDQYAESGELTHLNSSYAQHRRSAEITEDLVTMDEAAGRDQNHRNHRLFASMRSEYAAEAAKELADKKYDGGAVNVGIEYDKKSYAYYLNAARHGEGIQEPHVTSVLFLRAADRSRRASQNLEGLSGGTHGLSTIKNALKWLDLSQRAYRISASIARHDDLEDPVDTHKYRYLVESLSSETSFKAAVIYSRRKPPGMQAQAPMFLKMFNIAYDSARRAAHEAESVWQEAEDIGEDDDALKYRRLQARQHAYAGDAALKRAGVKVDRGDVGGEMKWLKRSIGQFRRSSDVFRELGMGKDEAAQLSWMGDAAWQMGDFTTSYEAFNRSAQVSEALGLRPSIMRARWSYSARASEAVGDYNSAYEQNMKAVEIWGAGEQRPQDFHHVVGNRIAAGRNAMQMFGQTGDEQWRRRGVEQLTQAREAIRKINMTAPAKHRHRHDSSYDQSLELIEDPELRDQLSLCPYRPDGKPVWDGREIVDPRWKWLRRV
ncbi:MAG: hypothetical protein GF416_01490 [Candidatus Altiarchaeales archaeon]|nr:hypothetical protein [Candidatus Altiarchaeales archaeon]MBD3415788.1 hypothetical protein [Candidatus Altiarchaeales archaeon]